jgi:hypothetical protein
LKRTEKKGDNDMTGREFAEKYNGKQLKEIARDIAGSIVIREYDTRGNSSDIRRASTEIERDIIRKIAYGAMLAYRCDDTQIHGILDMAEFTLHQFIPEVNAYDTIYIPLRKVTETW